MKIFCLHHKPLINRKEKLLKIFNNQNIDVEWVENFEKNIDLPKNINKITDSEFSLSLKHKYCYQKMIYDDIQYSFILEDDIILNIDIKNFFNNILLEKNDCDIIFFGGTKNMVVKNLSNKIVYINSEYYSRCTHGVFITKKCCEKIIDKIEYNLPIDHEWNRLIKEYKLVCGWTSPFMEQGTILGIEESSIRDKYGRLKK